ncbi:hypothetical protein DM02DRAFT_620911 [Periconia macrospinosa]|uniref:Uncharacterized protein n=1 Tax=Periconia macrospinosa TaxID=97972 RepID=A0A2V1CY48_9PLEO|nr:hypothetical protein DM02DRAFT_620911 [Periconia macrospinosa]
MLDTSVEPKTELPKGCKILDQKDPHGVNRFECGPNVDSDLDLLPSPGESLVVGLTTLTYKYSSTVNQFWHFFTAPAGHEKVGCESKAPVQQITPKGRSNPALSSQVNSDNPPWPGGDWSLKIGDQDCSYKNDGASVGRLWCPTRDIACEEMPKKNSADGVLKCQPESTFHAVVRCNF